MGRPSMHQPDGKERVENDETRLYKTIEQEISSHWPWPAPSKDAVACFDRPDQKNVRVLPLRRLESELRAID